MITMAAERTLALLEEYAKARVEEKTYRRAMQALRCEKADDEIPRCYLDPLGTDVAAWCQPCRVRGEAWKLFKSIRKANKATLRRLEDLGLGLNVPDRPDDPPEPMGLLELMHDEA